MAQTNKRKTVVRYDRIIAVAVIFIILIVLLVSCITSCGGDNSTGDSSSGKDNSVVSTDPASGAMIITRRTELLQLMSIPFIPTG